MDRRVVRDHGSVARTAVLVVPVLFLLVLFVVPVAAVVRMGLRDGAGELFAVYGDARTWSVLAFTVLQAALSTVATLVVAIPAAVVIAGYRFPGRGLLRALVLVPFVMPTVVVAAAFLAIIGPTGFLGVDLSGSVWGLVLAHMFLNLAVVIRVLGAALATLDPDFENAARVLGASRWQAWRRVTWPLVAPSVRAASAIVFLFCFTSFGVVQVLGDGQLRTLEVEIYRSTAYLLDLPTAAALALLQLMAVVAMLVVVGRGRRVVSGRAVDVARRPHGWRESSLVALVATLTALLVLGPLIVIAARSVLVGGQWSTAGWELLFSPGETTNAVQPWRAVLASLRTSIAATLLAVVVGGAAAVGLAMGRRGTWLRSVDAMMLLPLGTSAVTVGLGMLLAFGRPPVDLRNTGLLIVLAQALVAMPFVVRVLAPGFESFDRRYLEVAAVLGRSTWQAVRSVAVPLLLPLITVAVGFAFAVTLGEFGATVFLATPADPTLPVAISRLLARPGAVTVAAAYAASTVLMLITVAVVVAVDRVRVGRAVVF
ncbi:MAG: iron ABC transporter permease [Actinobacteria bacterium]|nr:iron ABC transporter permease [Actinomycetota bacterium]